jgi:hypothetical protein
MPEGDEINIFYDSYISSATLHVPASAIEAYSSTAPWSEFSQIVAIEGTDIGEVKASTSSVDSPYYNLGGIRVIQPKRGIYIKDGRKYLKK